VSGRLFPDEAAVDGNLIKKAVHAGEFDDGQ
jgi:hypothetical protein